MLLFAKNQVVDRLRRLSFLSLQIGGLNKLLVTSSYIVHPEYICVSHSGRAIKDIGVFFGKQLVTESLLELIRSEKPRFSLETSLFFAL